MMGPVHDFISHQYLMATDVCRISRGRSWGCRLCWRNSKRMAAGSPCEVLSVRCGHPIMHTQLNDFQNHDGIRRETRREVVLATTPARPSPHLRLSNQTCREQTHPCVHIGCCEQANRSFRFYSLMPPSLAHLSLSHSLCVSLCLSVCVFVCPAADRSLMPLWIWREREGGRERERESEREKESFLQPDATLDLDLLHHLVVYPGELS